MSGPDVAFSRGRFTSRSTWHGSAVISWRCACPPHAGRHLPATVSLSRRSRARGSTVPLAGPRRGPPLYMLKGADFVAAA